MRTLTRYWLVLPLLLVSRLAAGQSVVPPEAAHVEFGAMWWKPDPAITLASGAGSTPVDFVTDLGIAKDRFREIRLVLRGVKHKFRFAYIPVEYATQSYSVPRSITFAGTAYPAGVPVSTTVDWKLYRFSYEWDFVSTRRAYLGVIADIKYNKLNTRIDSPLGGAGSQITVPVPSVGGVARVYVSDYISVTGELTGLKIDRTNFRGKTFDLDVFAQVNLTRTLAAQGGYRKLTIDYLVDDDEGNVELKGIYFGGLVRF